LSTSHEDLIKFHCCQWHYITTKVLSSSGTAKMV